MTKEQLSQLGKTLWGIADDLRRAMNADDFRDYMLSFLFLRYLSDNYEAAAKKTDAAALPFARGSSCMTRLPQYANRICRYLVCVLLCTEEHMRVFP